MKKTIIIIGIILAVFLAALFLVPILFKDTLLEKTKTTINKNVNAQVEFDDIRLSFFRNFPKVTIVITDATITGKGEFQNDTLLDVSSVGLKMGLFSLIGSSEKSIDEIELNQPKLKLMVNEAGNNNWSLIKEPANPPATSPTESFDLQLDEIIIENAVLIYDDREAKTLLQLDNINFDLQGEMYGTSAKLLADGKIGQFSLNYDGSNYISKVSLETKTLFNINYETMDISILENELLINRLPMNVTGSIQAPGDTMYFDLGIKTTESGFENFLALVPPDYEHYLEDMKTEGSATLAGTFKGFYYEESYPALKLDLDIRNGNLHYADLPEEIKNIKAAVAISKPQGDWDLTVIKIKEAHAEIRNNPVDLTLTLSNLVTDPRFDGAFVGKINFQHLKDALPLDSVNMTGIVDANLFVKGNYSAIENEQYENIKSDGAVVLSDYSFQSPKLTQVLYVSNGRMQFSPENINLEQFKMRLGQSDFNLTGKVSNYLNYFLKDGELRGNLQLNSSRVNLNELFRLQQVEYETPEETQPRQQSTDNETEALAFDIPSDVNFTFRSSINDAVLDNVPISNIQGLITAQNGKLVLNDLGMHLLDGQLNLTGSYQNNPQNQPLFDFNLVVSDFDIPMAAKTITGIQKMIPVIDDSKGRFSSNMKLTGQFDEMLKLKMPTVNGSGTLMTKNLQIVNSPVLLQIGGLLNEEKLKNVSVDDFKANFTINNGNLLLKPFTTRIAGQETAISGSLNTQNLLDMRMDFQVQRDAFGKDIQNILSILPGQQNIQVIPAAVAIKGPVNEPAVNVDLSEARKKITDEVKKSTKEDLQKTIDKVGEGLKNIFK